MTTPVLLHLMGSIESLAATVRLLADRVSQLEQAATPAPTPPGPGNGHGKPKGA